MHPNLIGNVLGGIWLVVRIELTRGTRKVEVAQGPKALRNVDICFVAPPEIISSSSAGISNAFVMVIISVSPAVE